MQPIMQRRAFLKLGILSLTSLAFRPLQRTAAKLLAPSLGRVSAKSISVYREAVDTSAILFQRFRDELVNLYYEIDSPSGPTYNPRWYRVWRGFMHSGKIVKVKYNLNPIIRTIPTGGMLAEVTVPFTQAYRFLKSGEYQPVYRLYYGSIHWVTGLDTGMDDSPWYTITDELGELEYNVPASHLRVIQADELSPLSVDIPPERKRIEVSLTDQSLKAYEGDTVVLNSKISSGIATESSNGVPTKTPRGSFNIEIKMPSKHMGDGNITSDPEAYEFPGVPWTSFFVWDIGVAFHGTYWHDSFGIPMSHGCINMKNNEAKWLYRWSTPIIESHEWHKNGLGTRVTVA
ncbi:MAG: L,D-transpeptidase [Anaerolineaceae bacterium]|nr:L,D-transpeptidase [Anaerolineaceae bacterium]MBN2677057.1 L,D-transpeptidase [Anaerolineaceae bacterium]